MLPVLASQTPDEFHMELSIRRHGVPDVRGNQIVHPAQVEKRHTGVSMVLGMIIVVPKQKSENGT